MAKGYLVLADGYVFVGNLYQEPLKPWVGEIVFSTAMTGYTEILSDPSFFNQIVVLTNAEIGNYGVSLEDAQSNSIKARALVVRNFTEESYSWREDFSLMCWLKEHHIPLLSDLDTRALVSHVRESGVMMGAIGGENTSIKDLYEAAKSAPSMAGQRLSSFVSVKDVEVFKKSSIKNEARYRIIVMDFGVKKEILRDLARNHAEVIVVPGATPAEKLWALEPDGICLSNGPGDPHTEVEAIRTIKNSIGKVPIFGICLGHQILAQVLGFSTFKLKCGHRGSNHPVLDAQGRVNITAQNHGFAVDSASNTCKELPEYNLMDLTNEGLDLPDLWAFSVQFHPEGAPGPRDATHYFQKFMTMVKAFKAREKEKSDQKPREMENYV